MEKLISIIVPVYNSEKYLPECLDSICNQTYKNLQIILVDDCSTDNSGKICDDYALKDKRIEVFRSEKNGGQSASRNLGLKHAKGQWIGFVDNDDTIEPNMFEILYKNAIENNVLVSGCGNKRIEPDKTKICNLDNKQSGKYPTKSIVKNILIYPRDTWIEVWTKIYHVSLIDCLTFPLGCQMEDYMVNLPLLYSVKEIYFDSRALYNWYIRNTSQSNKKFFENRLTYFNVSEKINKWFMENTTDKDIQDAANIFEYCCKVQLLYDMVNTKEKKYIDIAKRWYKQVKQLGKSVNKSNNLSLKSKLASTYKLFKVKIA